MKILDLELYCNNLETIQRFYVRRLGLPMLSHSSAHLTVLVGHTRLTFRKIETVVAPYHLAISVPRGSLDVLMYYYDLDYLATQAPQQTIAYFPSWRAKACYFCDPEGNLLEFIARTDLNLDDPNLTLGDMFQGISEVGLATEDVPYTAEQLQRRFNVTQFSRTTPQPDFNALGDDSGLFILTKAGRPWLFTNTPAGLNYFRIQFVNGIDEEVQELYSYEVNRLPIGKPGAGLSQQVPDRMTDFAYWASQMLRINNPWTFFGWEINHLIDNVHSLPDTNAVINVVETFLLMHVRNISTERNYLFEATRLIRQAKGNLSIEALSEHLYVSKRQLERSFKDNYGTTPKLYQRIIRFRNAYESFQQTATTPNWLDVSYNFGYSDQAHFIRYFKGFSDDVPPLVFQDSGQYFRRPDRHRLSARA